MRNALPSWLDVKLGARMILKHPGLTAVAGIAIAVAIALGAVFDIAAGVVDAPLTLDEGDRIVAIEQVDAARNNQEERILLSGGAAAVGLFVAALSVEKLNAVIASVAAPMGGAPFWLHLRVSPGTVAYAFGLAVRRGARRRGSAGAECNGAQTAGATRTPRRGGASG